MAIHIFCALISLPSMLLAILVILLGKTGFKFLPILSAIGFVGLVLSGTGLVIINHANLLGVCLNGLLYMGSLAGLYVIYQKLASKKNALHQTDE